MCTKRSVSGLVHARCQTSFGMDGLTSILVYRGLVRRLIGKLKYKMVFDLLDTVVETMVSFGEFAVLSNGAWVVVPVPLYAQRLRWRGFNQAAEIGKRVAAYAGWGFAGDVLVRWRETKEQMTLARAERLTNVVGAFKVNEGILRRSGHSPVARHAQAFGSEAQARRDDKRDLSRLSRLSNNGLRGVDVLLVDDVWTTGATMRECAKVLKRAGARQVWGLTVAA